MGLPWLDPAALAEPHHCLHHQHVHSGSILQPDVATSSLPVLVPGVSEPTASSFLNVKVAQAGKEVLGQLLSESWHVVQRAIRGLLGPDSHGAAAHEGQEVRGMPLSAHLGPPLQLPLYLPKGLEAGPVVFQDVDGVLNRYSEDFTHIDGPMLDELAVQRLSKVLRESGASLVLSSEWRKHPDFLAVLQASLRKIDPGLPPMVAMTPTLCEDVRCRAEELQAFLATNPRLAASGRWVMVDDQDIASQAPRTLEGHFVKTDPLTGLTGERAEVLQQLLHTAGPSRGMSSAVASSFLGSSSLKTVALSERWTAVV